MKTFFMRRCDLDLSATRMREPVEVSRSESSVRADGAEYVDARMNGHLVEKSATESNCVRHCDDSMSLKEISARESQKT